MFGMFRESLKIWKMVWTKPIYCSCGSIRSTLLQMQSVEEYWLAVDGHEISNWSRQGKVILCISLMCMCNVMTILDLALQFSYYKVSKKLSKYLLIQRKATYARKMGKWTSFFSCSNISVKKLWFNCISVLWS